MKDIKTILCVDDDDIALRALHEFVKSADMYRVNSVSSGGSCLNFLRKNEADLVILDYKLTDSNGIDICKHIPAISINPDVPIIIVSVVDSHEIKEKNDCKNIVKIVQKPYEKNILLQDINDILLDE